MSNPAVREVGRVTGLPLPFSSGRGRTSILRVAVVNDAVSLCIGAESVRLDAAKRAVFERLYRKASREAAANKKAGTTA